MRNDRELIDGHLSGRHGKLTVLHVAGPANVAMNPDIVGRIREDQAGALIPQQRFIRGYVQRIATIDPIRSGVPQVADTGNGFLVGR